VLTDKVHDVWIDDVFYDLTFEAILDAQEGEGSRSVEADVTTQQVEPYIATAVGVVSYLQGASDIVDGTPVAEVRLATVEGNEHILLLRAGQDTAEGVYGEGIAHPQARVGQRWPDQPEGAAYVARLHLEAPSEIAQVKVTALPTGGRLHVRGVTLIDERDGTNVPLIMSTSGRFRQTHSGDVKVYEVLDALPRAYVVHHTRRIADDAQAIEAMADASFDPAQTAILASGTEIAAPASPSSVTVTHYSPQAIRLDVTLSDPGYLVVSDTWYPGWEARVDGVSTPIERANVHFRALYLSPGTHAVQFTYQPRLYSTGLGISLFSLAGVVWGAHLMVLRRLRTKTSPRSS